MGAYRIFISSPTDVQLERDRADDVLRRLNSVRAGRRQIEIIRWEHEFYNANADFQAQIASPADCELVICIFWKRLGSELPDKYARPDGTIPTGSEYEFESALEAAASRTEKVPDVLVYRKTAAVTFAAETVELEKAQYERFMQFWRRWFRNEKGHFVAGFQTFDSAQDFERQLEQNLRQWLSNQEVNVVWTSGSPFRGLEPFHVEHAPIFFGRDREIERARARLITLAGSGRPFLLVAGASGTGKSSLVRAGLIPRLAQPGGLSALGSTLRWTTLNPGAIAGDWALGLSSAVFAVSALGKELEQGDFGTPQALAALLERTDVTSVSPITSALGRAAAALAEAQGRSEISPVVLLILIDQLEEIFIWPQAEATKFLRMLRLLFNLPGSPVWLIATLRSDFQHRLLANDDLEVLVGRTEVRGPDEADRILELAFPTAAELREIIVQPASAAGLTFEVGLDGRDLGETLEREARPEAMPAVQFLLNELYERRNGSTLKLDVFDELGGVAGVMARRGEAVFQAADPAARLAFPRVIRALATQARGDMAPTARRVSEKSVENDAAALRMLSALKDARLVISDQGEMKIAHDTLLTGWNRLAEQIATEQRLFEARDRLEQLCRLWVQGEKGENRPRRLLLEGFTLAEGRELLAKWGKAALDDKQSGLSSFILASDRLERRRRRTTQGVAWVLALVFGALALQWYSNWLQAEVALAIAKSREALRDNQVETAIGHAADAFNWMPHEPSRSALGAAIAELSPHLMATFDIGANAAAELTWLDRDTIAYTNAGGNIIEIAARPQHSRNVIARWPSLRSSDSLPKASRVVALRAVTPRAMTMVMEDGEMSVLRRDPGAAPAAPNYKAAVPTVAAAATIGPSGKFAVLATIGGDAVIIECNAPPDGDHKECQQHQLIGIRAKAVAIEDTETRFAIADYEGALTVFDRSGQAISQRLQLATDLVSLAWASDRNALAVGTSDGEVAIVDFEAGILRKTGGAAVPGHPVTTLAWRPGYRDLAFSCGGQAICLLRHETGSQLSEATPIQLWHAHSHKVTRLAWSPSGDVLASLALDDTIRLWRGAQNTDAVRSFYSEVVAEHTVLAASNDGRWLAAGDRRGSVRIWDTTTMVVVRSVTFGTGLQIAHLSWSPSGRSLAVATDSGLVASMTARVEEPVRVLSISTDAHSRITWAEQDQTIVLPLGSDGRLALIDVSGADLRVKGYIAALSGQRRPWGVVADPATDRLFASYTDAAGEIHIWNLNSARSLGAMSYNLLVPRDRDAGGCLSITPDGRWLAVSGGDSYVRIFDVVNASAWRAVPISAGKTHCVSFSPSGQKLAALGSDGKLYVWSMEYQRVKTFAILRAAPQLKRTLENIERQSHPRWLAWLGDTQIAVASETSSVELINLDTDRWLHRLQDVRSVAVPSSGRGD